MIKTNDFYVVSGFQNYCTTGGHTAGPVVVTRVGINGRCVGERVCTKCGDSMRVMEYAASVKRRGGSK